MGGEQFSGLADAVNEAGGVLTLTKMAGHFLSKVAPKFLATLGVDGGVADHRKFVGSRCDKDEDGVAISCFRHAH